MLFKLRLSRIGMASCPEVICRGGKGLLPCLITYAVIKTSNRELDEAGHCQPSKCPDPGCLPQAGIQRSSEAQLTYRAAKEAGQWRHHACTSPIRQTEQLEDMQTGVQQQSTKLRKQISTSDLKNPDQ